MMSDSDIGALFYFGVAFIVGCVVTVFNRDKPTWEAALTGFGVGGAWGLIVAIAFLVAFAAILLSPFALVAWVARKVSR